MINCLHQIGGLDPEKPNQLNRYILSKAIRNNRGFKSWGLDHSVLNGADDKICKILQLYSIHDISTEEVRQVWSEMTDLGTLGT